MYRFKISILSLVITTIMTGCGTQSFSSKSTFDANSDIAAIMDSVNEFQQLSDSAYSNGSVENLKRVAILNSAALDDIEKNTKIMLKHFADNWDSIGAGDSTDGISREVLKEWGEAYLFWVKYQKKIQGIGEECLANLETFDACRAQKLPQTLELERQSTKPLSIVQAKIQAWQDKYSDT